MATLTIYLLRDSVATAEEAVVTGAKPYVIADGPSEYGKLFVKPTHPRPPKWADLFENYVDKKLLGNVQSSAAAFIVPVDGRLFALTFGQGRFLIHPDAYEERFGLVVTLNSIGSDALRSIDKRTFVDDQNSRVQTSQASSALSFGVDIERDLIRGIVGRPLSAKLGRRLAGADALTVTTDAAVPDLRRLLRRYLKKFQSKDYQANFPWVDQVCQLNSKGQKATRLDALLVEKLKDAWTKNGLIDGCWLAVPDSVDGFKFTQSAGEGVSNDLHLPGLVQAFPKEEPSLQFLRKHYAMPVDEEEHVLDRWPIYRCIHCEIDEGEKSFILSAGRWFEIDKDFVTDVDAAFKSIPRYTKPLPIYDHADEDDYNRSAVNGSQGRWCLMDKKMLRVGGVYDKVEFIKHYGSSSVLSHLFNQGLVSGELLKSQVGYVDLANSELSAAHQLPPDIKGAKLPRNVSEYTIVFGIISQSEKPDLHLPFFAKVVLKSVYTRLSELGYGSIMLAKISCDPMVKLRKAIKPKKPGKKQTRK